LCVDLAETTDEDVKEVLGQRVHRDEKRLFAVAGHDPRGCSISNARPVCLPGAQWGAKAQLRELLDKDRNPAAAASGVHPGYRKV